MTSDKLIQPPYASPSAANQLPPFTEVEPYRVLTIPVAPHRGSTILVLGILGLMFCFLFSIAAWQMGRADLHTMEMGLMDKSGHGLTMAGYIMGIIGTLIILIPLAIFAMFIIFTLIAHAGR
jgi:hypothetical protein